MRCEVRPPLIAMLAAQRVEQPVRIASVTVVNKRTAVGDVIDGRPPHRRGGVARRISTRSACGGRDASVRAWRRPRLASHG